MILTLIIFSLLIAAIILPSLVGKQKSQLESVQDSLDQRMHQLKQEFQFRTKELSRRLKSGDLDEEEWQHLSKELELDTIASIDSTEQASRAEKTEQSMVLAAGLILLIVIAGFLSYQFSTNTQRAEEFNQVNNALIANPNYVLELSEIAMNKKDRDSLEKLYLALRRAADLEPNKASHWRALSAFNIQYGRTKEAIHASKMAVQLEPKNDDVRVELAQVLTRSKEEKDNRQANLILMEIVRSNPNHQGALVTLGFNAFNLGNYAVAIEAWEKLLPTRKPGSEGAKMLQQSIQVAKMKMAQTDSSSVAQTSSSISSDAKTNGHENKTEVNGPHLAVNISIPESIRKDLSGTESVFIFAKAVNGPPLPLAVIRTTVSQLSDTFVLSDANAMRPEFQLSKFQEVEVVGRISLSGGATAKPGDIEGRSNAFKAPFKGQSVSVVIENKIN